MSCDHHFQDFSFTAIHPMHASWHVMEQTNTIGLTPLHQKGCGKWLLPFTTVRGVQSDLKCACFVKSV